MGYQSFKCQHCGAREYDTVDLNNIKCSYCGSIYEKENKEKLEIRALLDSAYTHLRELKNFSAARGFFQSALLKETDNIEALWGMVLCDFGVLYEKDARTGLFLPIFYKRTKSQVIENEYYKKILNTRTSAEVKKEYIKKAEELEKVRQAVYYKALSKNKKHDIFICYKRSANLDESNECQSKNLTNDFATANDMYLNLLTANYTPFIDRKEIEAGSADYEAEICDALFHAKLLIIVASKVEYLNSQWVSSEWNRFMDMHQGEKDRKVVVWYEHIDPENFPERLSKIQNINSSEFNASKKIFEIATEIISPPVTNPYPIPKPPQPKPHVSKTFILTGVSALLICIIAVLCNIFNVGATLSTIVFCGLIILQMLWLMHVAKTSNTGNISVFLNATISSICAILIIINSVNMLFLQIFIGVATIFSIGYAVYYSFTKNHTELMQEIIVYAFLGVIILNLIINGWVRNAYLEFSIISGLILLGEIIFHIKKNDDFYICLEFPSATIFISIVLSIILMLFPETNLWARTYEFFLTIYETLINKADTNMTAYLEANPEPSAFLTQFSKLITIVIYNYTWLTILLFCIMLYMVIYYFVEKESEIKTFWMIICVVNTLILVYNIVVLNLFGRISDDIWNNLLLGMLVATAGSVISPWLDLESLSSIKIKNDWIAILYYIIVCFINVALCGYILLMIT